jgi:hypothetical protein
LRRFFVGHLRNLWIVKALTLWESQPHSTNRLPIPQAAFRATNGRSRAPPRARAHQARLLENERQIDVERARFTTESYRQTEGQPIALRRAQMLLHLARTLSIAIEPDELIVGNRSLLPRMGVIAPEGAVDWIDRELEILPTRPQDRFNITPAQIRELRDEIFPYWRGKTHRGHRRAARARRCARGRAGQSLLAQPDRPRPGAHPARRGGWLRLGIGGLRRQVLAAREQEMRLTQRRKDAKMRREKNDSGTRGCLCVASASPRLCVRSNRRTHGLL